MDNIQDPGSSMGM